MSSKAQSGAAMSCSTAREHLSAAMDDELGAPIHTALAHHLDTCTACTDHRTALGHLRRAVRYEAIDDVPDVTDGVIQTVRDRQRRRARADVLAAAAAFVTAALAGAAFVGLDLRQPAQVLASVSDAVVGAQTEVGSLRADLTIHERGWHPAVPERVYDGHLAYRAPESLALGLTDRTAYPDAGWVPNHIEVVADDATWWARGPAPCPTDALPECADPEPRTQAMTGREPFRAANPVPLDLIVPVRSFALGAHQDLRESRTFDGRAAVGVTTSAAQVAPLLDGLRQAGTLRQVHPADRAEVWLDAEALVPLVVRIRAGEGPERARWAARHGYTDDAGSTILRIELSSVVINGTVDDAAFPPPPADADPRDAGFADRPERDHRVEVPPPGWLPAGMTPHRSGVLEANADAPTVAVSSWSDGRAWLKVRATRDWTGNRLFGQLGDAVRQVETSNGIAYVGEGGRAVAIHGAGIDLVVTGSLREADLLRVAESLDVVGLAVPVRWAEAGSVPVDRLAEHAAGFLRPPELDGFAPAAATLSDGALVVVVTGPGARSFVLTQTPDAALTPPLEPDVRGVEVRGTAGRYTPGSGELEWVEAGRVVSLRSQTLSVDELVSIADRLEAD